MIAFREGLETPNQHIAFAWPHEVDRKGSVERVVLAESLGNNLLNSQQLRLIVCSYTDYLITVFVLATAGSHVVVCTRLHGIVGHR